METNEHPGEIGDVTRIDGPLAEAHVAQTIGTVEMRPVFCERLQQAVRVMEGLAARGGAEKFSLSGFAYYTARGIVACIAGHCGFDAWFQARGFETTAGDFIGTVSISVEDFFGTETPFFATYYSGELQRRPDLITIADAIAALKKEIEAFSDERREVSSERESAK